MTKMLDLIVLASAIELLFFTGSVDGWHRFGYYLAGAGMECREKQASRLGERLIIEKLDNLNK